MGMFDYVRHGEKLYQTKDTPDQFLSEYRIVAGRLIGDEWHHESVSDENLPFPDMPFIGSIARVIDKADVDQNWHGYLYLTADKNDDYRQYRAKFTDGNLVSVEPCE